MSTTTEAATTSTLPIETTTIVLGTTTTLDITTTTSITACPYGWSHFGESCYWVYEEEKNWPAAREACKNLSPGADLASSISEAEDNFLGKLFLDSRQPYIWLGGNDLDVEGAWTWSDGSEFSCENWDPLNNEGNGGPAESCLYKSISNHKT